MLKKLQLILLLAMLTVGCARQTATPAAPGSREAASSAASSQASKPIGETDEADGAQPAAEGDAPQEALDTPDKYLSDLVEQAAAAFVTPEMSEYQRAKAAFDYMIENTYLAEPIGQELWRIHGGGDTPLPFVEQRAISPLRFGVGMCEDYAAALTMLLRGVGLEAQYVPGLTYSLEGHLVDHAWTLVRVDGVWYHLDCQLEDNISRRGSVRYRYFLKGDAAMSSSHRWGQNLIDSGLLTPEQNAEITRDYLAPVCPQNYTTPEPHPLADTPTPDLQALQAQAQAALTAYENEHGPLPAMELNTTPPVFGLAGFGPPDEG